jgi:hypothetical protein
MSLSRALRDRCDRHLTYGYTGGDEHPIRSAYHADICAADFFRLPRGRSAGLRGLSAAAGAVHVNRARGTQSSPDSGLSKVLYVAFRCASV